jgi:hypothetical protein
MAIIPLVISVCFQNWKWNWVNDVLKLSDIQRELQVVLYTTKQNYLHSTFREWKKLWNHAYILKETILKDIAA